MEFLNTLGVPPWAAVAGLSAAFVLLLVGFTRSLRQPQRDGSDGDQAPPRPEPRAQASSPEPDAEAAIRDALARGKKIEAIKLYRALHRVSLKDAKDAVERISRLK